MATWLRTMPEVHRRVLLALGPEPVRAADVAARFGWGTARAVSVLKALRVRGYATCHYREGEHRRVGRWALTEAGRKRAVELVEAHGRLEAIRR